MEDRKPKIYICEGCDIAKAVNVEALKTMVTNEQKIAECESNKALCSDESCQSIKADIKDNGINQVVIAACSPRMMVDKFTFDNAQTIRASLREHVSWTQPEGEEDTQMLAEDNIRMAIAQSKNTTPPTPHGEGVESKKIMVVGGGVTGLHAAHQASIAGHDVLLVEKSDKLGGWANHFSKTLPHLPPYNEPQNNDIAELIKNVSDNKKIEVKTNTIVTNTDGMPGAYKVSLKNGKGDINDLVGSIIVATGFRPYDANKLEHLSYSQSKDIITNIEFEELLASNKLAKPSNGEKIESIAFIQCAGSRDQNHLPYCSGFCCKTSIKQAMQLAESNPDAMIYIIYEEMRTPGLSEELFKKAQEMGIIFQKSKVNNIDADLKINLTDQLLGEDIILDGLDMVVLATGIVPNSTNIDLEPAEKGKIQIADDINPLSSVTQYEGRPESEDLIFDEKAEPALPGGSLLNLQYRQGPHIPVLANGFLDSHYICFPYETRRTGIYTCGTVKKPMSIAESKQDAEGAVLKAIQAMKAADQSVAVHPRVGDLSYPEFGLNICTKCRRCTVECPFGAIDEDEKDYPVLKPSRCRRCGTCMGACPVRTISFKNYNVQMVTDMISSVEIPDEFDEKPRIMVFACENDAYPAIDMAAVKRSPLSPYIRIIPVRCLGSVTLLWISNALEQGYDGVMLLGCKSGNDYQCHFVKGSALAQERLSKVGETLKSLMLEEERVQIEEISIADSGKVDKMLNEFAQKIDDIGPNPFKGF